MSKLRSLSTAFWSDPFIEDLTPSQKLLFIYLITNDKTNMLGIYESSIKKMSFETGIKKDELSKALDKFEKEGKVKYVKNYVVLINYMKHQKFNLNMKKSAIDVYNNLPNDLKINELSVSKNKPEEGFETLLKGYGMVSKVEVKVETKNEDEFKDEPKPKKEGIIYPFDSENFLKNWDLWKTYKKDEHKFNYKTLVSEQAALKKLVELGETEENCIKIITESISNGWKGFYKLQDNGHQKNSTNNNSGTAATNFKGDTFD